jgi:hypothetical protein
MKAKKVKSVILASEVIDKVKKHKEKTGVQIIHFVEQAILEKLKRESK